MATLVRLSNGNWTKVTEYSRKDPRVKNAIKKAMENRTFPYYKPRIVDMVNYWGHEHPELSH